MSFYISGPVQSDPNVLKARALDYLTTYMPAGFKVESGDPIDLLCEAFSLQSAEQADVANAMLDSAFRYLGTLVGVPPIDALPAQASCLFTVQDTVGYTITAGTSIGLQDATGTLQGFTLLADIIIAPGASTGTGTVQAETAGTATNGLSGAAQLIQADPFVTAATLAAATGGIDAELDSVFLGRLAETLTLLAFRPKLAPDFAILARSIPGVYRATAVDNLKPGPPYDSAAEATGVEKNVTVAVADINGNPVGSTIRGAVQTYLRSLLEQNFLVWAVDPQYGQIDVTAAGVFSWPGWDTADVRTRVIAALDTLLSSANFAADVTGNAARWQNDPVIRAGLIAQTLYSVPGVRYVDPQPTFGLHGGALATTDVTLGAGSAIPALPTPGTMTITVTST